MRLGHYYCCTAVAPVRAMDFTPETDTDRLPANLNSRNSDQSHVLGMWVGYQ